MNAQPSSARKALIVPHGWTRDAPTRELSQLVQGWCLQHHERRMELLHHVAVVAGQHARELADVVRDPIEVEPRLIDARDRLKRGMQPQQVAYRQHERAPQVDIAVRRRKPRQMRPADRRKNGSGPATRDGGQVLAVQHPPDLCELRVVHDDSSLPKRKRCPVPLPAAGKGT